MARKTSTSRVHRSWIFTTFSDKVIASVQTRISEIKYVCIYEELNKVTQIRYFNGFVVFNNTKGERTVKLLLNDDKAQLRIVLNMDCDNPCGITPSINGKLVFKYGDLFSADTGFKNLDSQKEKEDKNKKKPDNSCFENNQFTQDKKTFGTEKALFPDSVYRALDARMMAESKNVEMLDELADRIESKRMSTTYLARYAPKLFNKLLKLHPRFEIKEDRVPLKVIFIHGRTGLGKTQFKDTMREFLNIRLYNIDTFKFYNGMLSDVRMMNLDKFDAKPFPSKKFNEFCDNKQQKLSAKHKKINVNPDFLLITSILGLEELYARVESKEKKSISQRIDVYIHIEHHTKIHNKLTLTIMNHRDKEEVRHEYIVPIRKPTNISIIQTIVRTFINALITIYKQTEESALLNKAFIDFYSSKIQ